MVTMLSTQTAPGLSYLVTGSEYRFVLKDTKGNTHEQKSTLKKYYYFYFPRVITIKGKSVLRAEKGF